MTDPRTALPAFGRWWQVAAGVLALAALAAGLAGLLRDRTAGVVRESAEVGGTPVALLRPDGPGPAPGLVVAHGFAGSAVLMDPLATSWARAGFAVAVLDFPGHGGNTDLLRADGGADGRPQLTSTVDRVADWLTRQPGVAPGPVGLVGHSMGAGAVVEAAVADAASPAPRYAATVALSLPSADAVPDGRPAAPANLLLLWGAAEQQRFADASLAALRAAYPGAEPGMRYGELTQGTAREAREVPGAEHLSILWRTDTAAWTHEWLAAAIGAASPGDVVLAPRILYVALIATGALLALVPLSGLLLGTGRAAVADPVPAGRSLLVMAVAAVAASLLAAAAAPLGDRLPMAVGGHLALWFSGGAAALLLGARWARTRVPAARPGASTLVAAAVLAGWTTAGFVLPARLAWAPVVLAGPRWPLLLLFGAVFLAWFAGDELLVRRTGRGRRALLQVSGRLIVVAALLGGVLLLDAPGFLLLLLPLMVPLLALLGAAAWITAGRTSSVLVPAAMQALPLALLVATTFPLVAGS